MGLISLIRDKITRPRINIAFSIFCFFFPPVLGSTASFAFNGGGLWSVFEIAYRRFRFNIDRPMLALMLAFYAYCGVMLLASLVNNSLGRDATHLLSLVTFLFFPFSYTTWSMTAKPVLARTIVLSSMAACYGAFLVAIVQYYSLGMRAEGGAGNAIVFAMVLSLSVVVCLDGALSGIIRARAVLIGAALAGTIAILYSGSRIVWVSMPLAGLAVLLLHRHSLKQNNFLRLLLTFAILGVIAVVLGYQAISARTGSLFTDWAALDGHGDYTTALGMRIALWHLGVDACLQAPILGHGMGAVNLLIPQGLHDKFNILGGYSHFHNGFLTATVEAGIAGAIALAAIFVVATRNAAKVIRASVEPIERFGATMILTTVITYLTCGMTGILIGHDILDSVLMIFFVSGTYLASGTTVQTDLTLPADALPSRAGPAQR